MAFQSRNVAFAQVDGPSGAKIMATVLFAKDPKRRLEVWWANQASRSDTHLIVINGASTWSAPSQLRLGLTLAQLEQINGKSFKLTGFRQEQCRDLDRLEWRQPLPRTRWLQGRHQPAAAHGISRLRLGALPANREFTSSDSAMRTVNPEVSEILIGY